MINNQSKLNGTSEGKPKRRILNPVIPIQRPVAKELKKTDYMAVKCRITPNDNDSAVYELNVPYFNTGTAEEFLNWRENLSKVVTGQNITEVADKFATVRRLLKGDALTAFQNITATGSETAGSFNAAIKKLTRHVFPLKAEQQQKRYMRRVMRKPSEMDSQQFVSRVGELNRYLQEFPASNNRVSATKLDDDEIMDILEFSVPNSWQRQMVLQDFDPLDSTPAQFVNFCQRMEMIESDGKPPAKGNGKRNDGKRRKTADGSTATDDSKDCALCGKGCGHSTNKCWSIKKLAKERAAAKGAISAKAKGKGGKPYPKNEVNAMINENIVKAINKITQSDEKKKKKKKDEEIHAFEKLKVKKDGEIDVESESSDDESHDCEIYGRYSPETETDEE